MPEVYRESRVYRERGDSSSDDDRYKTSTVRRYKVTPSRVERVERIERVEEIEDDRRSRYSAHPARNSGELLEVERRERSYIPERPRSAFDPSPRSTLVERQVIEREREVDPYRDGDRSRSFVYEKEVERERERERDPYRDPGRSRTVIYEKEVEREVEPQSARDWDRRSAAAWDHRDEPEVRVEKRIERREDGEVRVEKRVEEHRDDPYGGEVDRYRKETEYYSPISPPPIPAPVIIRQRAPEPQQIIVQEAPAPAPIIVPRQEPGIVVVREREEPREMVRRDPREDEYYYRRETRDVGPYRRDEREYGVERYDRRRRGRDYNSDGASDEDYYVKRTVIRRERSPSPDHHKLHLAEGALAAAGVTALIASRRGKNGELPENRGRKVIAGAALGALGTEAFKRARSAYGERYGDGDRDRDRSRSRSKSRDRHSKLKTGLGLAAAALAVAGAAKYYQSNKVEKEELSRGRSRNRGESSGSYSSRSRSGGRRKSKSRTRSVAKAALGTAAAAGIVQHFRNKSKGPGKSRSRSRLRTGAEIAAAGLAGGVASKIWSGRKDKKERERERELSDDEYEEDLRRDRERRRSRDRSQARSLYSEPRSADPELGLVEYGMEPLPPTHVYGYESATEERRHRRHHRDDDYSDSEAEDKKDKKRSRSRLREMAAAAVGTGAAAIGIKEYKKKKDKEKDKERRSRERERDLRDREVDRDRERDRERDRRRYEEESNPDGYYSDYDRPPSPPHASGGAYYPPHPAPAAGFTHHPNYSTPTVSDYPAYNPQEYASYPPPPPGPPPMGPSPPTASGGTMGFPPGPPPPGGPPGPRLGPDHVSEETSRSRPEDATVRDAPRAPTSGEDGVEWRRRTRKLRPRSRSSSTSTVSGSDDLSPPGGSKSVVFIPLSPQSSRTLQRHHQEHAELTAKEENPDPPVLSEAQLASLPNRPTPFRRRSSDPSSDRPLVSRRRGRNTDSPSDSGDEIEDLPPRFDPEGRSLDGGGGRRWTTHQGTFEYRPQRGDGWNARGAWSVGGTDDVAVQRIVHDVGGVLQGRASWKDLLKDVVGAVQESQSHSKAQGRIAEGDDDDDDDEDPRRRRRRRRTG